MSADLEVLSENWAIIGPILSIDDDPQYETALARVDALIDDGALDPQHPLHSLLNVLGTLVRAHEEKHHPMPAVAGVQILRFLMDQHSVGPADLPEVGDQNEVLEILGGERALDSSQIVHLAARFQVPADVFMDRAA